MQTNYQQPLNELTAQQLKEKLAVLKMQKQDLQNCIQRHLSEREPEKCDGLKQKLNILDIEIQSVAKELNTRDVN